MPAIEISYRRYFPREGLKEEVDRLVREAKADLPKGAEVRIVISAVSDHYVFSGVIRLQGAFYSSELCVSKKAATGRARLWQIEPLGLLLRDLILQCRHRASPRV